MATSGTGARSSKMRRVAQHLPPLYWALGVARYLQYRRRLHVAENTYTSSPELPPPHLRYRVHRAFDERSYIDVGTAVAEKLTALVHMHRIPHDRVLDLGCGPGRVIKWLRGMLPAAEFFGSDIDAEAIDWARSCLADVGTFSVNSFEPPLEFAPSSFDLVYSISLFTHLDEALQDRWLAEINRVLKPGGFLIATVHGAPTFSSCYENELSELAEKGFAFRVDRRGWLKLDGLPDFYQTTFHTQDYVSRRWSKHFEIVDHLEGGLGGHQDIVILRARPTPSMLSP
jgi:SAM-dependent methyltransferase